MKLSDNEEAESTELGDGLDAVSREKRGTWVFPGLMRRWTVASNTNNKYEKDLEGDELA